LAVLLYSNFEGGAEVIKITILIPVSRNDGQNVLPEEMGEILSELFLLCGGATMEGIVEGAWVDPETGMTYRDKHRKVSVAIRKRQKPEVIEFIRRTGHRLGQIAMYYEVGSKPKFLKID